MSVEVYVSRAFVFAKFITHFPGKWDWLAYLTSGAIVHLHTILKASHQ